MDKELLRHHIPFFSSCSVTYYHHCLFPFRVAHAWDWRENRGSRVTEAGQLAGNPYVWLGFVIWVMLTLNGLGTLGQNLNYSGGRASFSSLKSLMTPWSIPLAFLFTIWHLSLGILYFHSRKLAGQVPVLEKQSRKEVCNLKHVVKIFILFFSLKLIQSFSVTTCSQIDQEVCWQ